MLERRDAIAEHMCKVPGFVSSDFLKIDRSFGAELDKSTEDEVVVSAMINCVQTLGLRVVAERGGRAARPPARDRLRPRPGLPLLPPPLPAEEAMLFLKERW